MTPDNYINKAGVFKTIKTVLTFFENNAKIKL